MKHLLRKAFILGLSFLTVHPGQAQVSLHGNAVNLGAGCYRLTMSSSGQKGAIWYPGTVDVSQSWEMNATVFVGASNGGADGMAFVLRDEDAPNLGGGGSLLGYGGTATTPEIAPSVAVEIDTFQSGANSPGAGDIPADHLAIHRDGNLSHLDPDQLAGPVTADPSIGNIENNSDHELRVTYHAPTQTLTVYFNCVIRLSETVDLADIIGSNQAKWGFTASTGMLTNMHRVCNATWTVLEDDIAPNAMTCAGAPVDLTVADYAIDPVWSPSTGLSSTSGHLVTATLTSSQLYTVTYEDICGEEYTDEVYVEVPEIPALSLGADQIVCPGESVEFDLSGSDPALNFTWNDIPGDALYTATDAGTVIAQWGIGMCSNSDTVLVEHHPTYAVTWQEDPVVLCLDETETISAIDLNWNGPPVAWSWNTGSNSNAIEVNQPGFYSVDVETDNCAFSYSVEAVDSPNQGVDLGNDVLICGAESASFSSGYGSINTYWISGGNAAGSNAFSTTVENESTTVIVQVAIGACIETDTVQVTHVPAFDANLPEQLDLCLGASVTLSAATGAESYVWSNGVLQPTQVVDSPGTYALEMELDGCTFVDEVVVVPSPNTGVDLGLDAVACHGEPLTLSSGYSSSETEWWVNGAPEGEGSSWTVLNQDATVIAEVTIGGCVERDTVVIDYAPLFNTGLPSSLPLCNGDSTWLAANVGAPAYEWSTGATTTGIWLTAPGTYTLTTPIQGCEYATEVNVQNVPLPVFDLGTDQTICEGTTLLLSTGLFDADETSWSTGSAGPTLEVSSAGTYEVVVTENGCSAEDDIVISVQDLPVFDLGPDQHLCPDEVANLIIYPLPADADFNWSIAHYDPALTTNAPGVYSALVNWNGCLWTDDVVVERAAPVIIDIVEPLSFCEGESMVVSAENPENLFPIGYLWSNEETTPAVLIDRQGFYTVTAFNACDTVSKTFEVTLEYCDCPVYVPNAFTPDNDGSNDLFRPVLGCEPDSYRLEVFNTWGELIFATEDPATGWFGQVESDPETVEYSGYFTRSNVYHWRLEVAFVDEDSPLKPVRQTHEGHVHMVR